MGEHARESTREGRKRERRRRQVSEQLQEEAHARALSESPPAAIEVAVRMDMGADVAETVADLIPRLPLLVADRVVDQLWLRAVLIEQRRRTRIAERPAFVERADRLLAALDPSEAA